MSDVQVGSIFDDAPVTVRPGPGDAPAMAQGAVATIVQGAQAQGGVPAIMDVGTQNQNVPAPVQLPGDSEIASLQQSLRSVYGDITTKLLSTKKAGDAGDAMGKGINDLIMTSKGLNPQQQQHEGLFGRLKAKVQGEKEHLLANTQSIQTRMDGLIKGLDQTATLMKTRINDLEEMKKDNLAEQQKVSGGLAQVQSWLEQANQIIATAPQSMATSEQAAYYQDVHEKQQRYLMAEDDLKKMLTLYHQQALMLASEQNAGRTILDEFDRVKNLAIPSLMSLVAQQLIAMEQQQAMKTDSAIRDMTNAAITQAAQTLGENQVQIATMQQHSVISMDSLVKAQDILEQADQKVREIQAQGAIQRKEDEAKRLELEKRLLKSPVSA